MHSLDWLFAIGVLFFLLSAWAIGKYNYQNSGGEYALTVDRCQ